MGKKSTSQMLNSRPLQQKLPALRLILTVLGTVCCTEFAVLADSPETKQAVNYGTVLNTNGGFEDGLTGYYRTQPSASFVDTDQVFRGQNSVRLQGMGTGKGDANIVVTGGVACVKGKKYLFRFAIKAQNVGSDSQTLPSFSIIGGTGKPGAQKYLGTVYIKEDGDWKIQELTAEVPEGVINLGFWLHVPNKSKATVWFDEIEIREVLN